MELIDVLQDISQKSIAATSPTDLTIGTVTAIGPLQIVTQTSMQTLQASVLYLTAAVIEKKIPILTHSHTIDSLGHTHKTGGETSEEGLAGSYTDLPELEEIVCYENGVPLPVEGGYIILNRALAVGDKVLLLRVQRGQMFVVLSRIFTGG